MVNHIIKISSYYILNVIKKKILIGEIGINHNGSIGKAKELISLAKKIGFEVSFPLRCFQQLYRSYLATRYCSFKNE